MHEKLGLLRLRLTLSKVASGRRVFSGTQNHIFGA